MFEAGSNETVGWQGERWRGSYKNNQRNKKDCGKGLVRVLYDLKIDCVPGQGEERALKGRAEADLLFCLGASTRAGVEALKRH